jgi:ribonuclease Z
MARLHLPGTGAAVSDPHRTTTMLALENDTSVILIDCGGDLIQRLMMMDIHTAKISALIVTHEHADHVGGFPLLMEKLWLLGRREPLPVYGIEPAIAQARRIHNAFNTSDWPDYPGVSWHTFEHAPGATIIDDDAWEITATPGKHAVPVVGLRVTDRQGGGVLAYSCDTEPSSAICQMAHGANLLVHEATGEGYGHSSALQAAECAARALVYKLLLVHLPPEANLDEADMKSVRAVFARAEKGQEGGSYTF